jgi:hypothetical protein
MYILISNGMHVTRRTVTAVELPISLRGIDFETQQTTTTDGVVFWPTIATSHQTQPKRRRFY